MKLQRCCDKRDLGGPRNDDCERVVREGGAPGKTRTSNPQIRSLVLYPIELRAPARGRTLAKRHGACKVRGKAVCRPAKSPTKDLENPKNPAWNSYPLPLL